MNQFAIDRAGLTLTMLAPVDTMTLLRGKAIGNAVIAVIPGTVCFIAAALLLPGGDPALWVCIPLTAIAAYVTAAPVAAILSAIFPRAVDLNSIGRGSNAHGAAGLLGMLALRRRGGARHAAGHAGRPCPGAAAPRAAGPGGLDIRVAGNQPGPVPAGGRHLRPPP